MGCFCPILSLGLLFWVLHVATSECISTDTGFSSTVGMISDVTTTCHPEFISGSTLNDVILKQVQDDKPFVQDDKPAPLATSNLAANNLLAFNSKLFSCLSLGALWGFFTAGIHFSWLFSTLFNKFCIGFGLSLFLYSIAILIFSLSTAVWVSIQCYLFRFCSGLLSRIFCFGLITLTFFYLWEWVYPFFNPLLPLARYNQFLKLVFLVGCILRGQTKEECRNVSTVLRNWQVVQIKPCKQKGANDLIQSAFHCLNAAVEKIDYTKKTLFLAPETFFPYSLNKMPDVTKFWGATLPCNVYFLFGSQYEDIKTGKIYQCVYLLNQCRVINFYVKKHRVIFAERSPHWIPNYFKKAFFSKSVPFSKWRTNLGIESVDFNDFKIWPQMCSEFFLDYKIKGQHNPALKNNLICLFINDSWFEKAFQQLLRNYTKLKSAYHDIDILYVSHSSNNVEFYAANSSSISCCI